MERVQPAMDEHPGDGEWWAAHRFNTYDGLVALVIKLGGDPTADLFGAIAVR